MSYTRWAFAVVTWWDSVLNCPRMVNCKSEDFALELVKNLKANRTAILVKRDGQVV